MKTIYNTEIIEKSARTSEFAYSTQDFEQIHTFGNAQKQKVLRQILNLWKIY